MRTIWVLLGIAGVACGVFAIYIGVAVFSIHELCENDCRGGPSPGEIAVGTAIILLGLGMGAGGVYLMVKSGD